MVKGCWTNFRYLQGFFWRGGVLGICGDVCGNMWNLRVAYVEMCGNRCGNVSGDEVLGWGGVVLGGWGRGWCCGMVVWG